MMKYIKKAGWFLALLFVLISSLLSFLTLTTPGLYCVLSLAGLYAHHPLKLQGIKGRLLDEFSIETLSYHQGPTKVVLNNISLHWQIKSLGHQQLTIHSLSADSLEIKQNQHNQRIDDIRLHATLKNHHLVIDSLQAQTLNQNLNALLQIDTLQPYTLTSTIKISPKTSNQELITALIHLNGTLDLLTWDAQMNGPARASIQGTLSQLYEIEQSIKWKDLVWPFEKQTLTSKEGRITIKGKLPKLDIELNAKINRTPQEPWQVTAQISGEYPFTWDFNAALIQPLDASSTRPGLYTSLQLTGKLKDKEHAEVTLKVNPGRYQMEEEQPISSLAFKGGAIKAQLSPKALVGQGSIAIDQQKKLDIHFVLPAFHLLQGLKEDQSFSSSLNLEISSLDFLKALNPELQNPKGRLTASLKSYGTFKKSILKSSIALKHASVTLPTLGLTLDSIDATFKGAHNRWEGAGTISSGTQILRLKGEGQLQPELTSTLWLEGSDFPVVNTNEYLVKISPHLKMSFNKNILNLSGDILVPSAQIKINSFSNSVGLSSDVIFESKEKPATSPLHTQMDLNVSMGKAVELSAKGLHATLAGTVHIKQAPQSALSATGELTVVKGEYKAYGQNLAIEQGELLFTGGGLDNPGINLRAAKNIDTSSTTQSSNNQLFDFKNNNAQSSMTQGNMKVGVEVSGRLLDPEIQLFSTPSNLSQADILSMLVLGRPANQANKAGGQLLLAAISSMNLNGATKGTQLLEQLKQSLGVDFNVETNSNYNILTNTVSDKTALVVSKSLSKRISLSYNVGLSQADPNVVTLKYLLNKWFSIQVSNSNTSNGIDVLYTSHH